MSTGRSTIERNQYNWSWGFSNGPLSIVSNAPYQRSIAERTGAQMSTGRGKETNSYLHYLSDT